MYIKLNLKVWLYYNFTICFIKHCLLQDLKTYANFTHKQNVGWTFIELKRIGGFGKLFNNASIKPLAAFIQIFYRDMSLNAMLDSYLSEKACPDNKFTVS